MPDNSPTFQRWDLDRQWVQVPKGRPNVCAKSAHLRDLWRVRRRDGPMRCTPNSREFSVRAYYCPKTQAAAGVSGSMMNFAKIWPLVLCEVLGLSLAFAPSV